MLRTRNCGPARGVAATLILRLALAFLGKALPPSEEWLRAPSGSRGQATEARSGVTGRAELDTGLTKTAPRGGPGPSHAGTCHWY